MKQEINKKWLVLIAALAMLSFTLKDADFKQLEAFTWKDILPILFIAAIIFLLKTSILSVVLLAVKKVWDRLTKKLVNSDAYNFFSVIEKQDKYAYYYSF